MWRLLPCPQAVVLAGSEELGFQPAPFDASGDLPDMAAGAIDAAYRLRSRAAARIVLRREERGGRLAHRPPGDGQ